MKKIIIYFLIFLLIFFFLPALLTKKEIKVSSTPSNSELTEEQKEGNKGKDTSIENTYNYKKYGTIKLLHKKTNEIEEVELDNYLYHVVSAEMPVDYEIEALKAQAVVARTYTIYKINNKKHDNADICDDSTCCQAWVDKDTRFARWDENKREENWNKIKKA